MDPLIDLMLLLILLFVALSTIGFVGVRLLHNRYGTNYALISTIRSRLADTSEFLMKIAPFVPQAPFAYEPFSQLDKGLVDGYRVLRSSKMGIQRRLRKLPDPSLYKISHRDFIPFDSLARCQILDSLNKELVDIYQISEGWSAEIENLEGYLEKLEQFKGDLVEISVRLRDDCSELRRSLSNLRNEPYNMKGLDDVSEIAQQMLAFILDVTSRLDQAIFESSMEVQKEYRIRISQAHHAFSYAEMRLTEGIEFVGHLELTWQWCNEHLGAISELNGEIDSRIEVLLGRKLRLEEILEKHEELQTLSLEVHALRQIATPDALSSLAGSLVKSGHGNPLLTQIRSLQSTILIDIQQMEYVYETAIQLVAILQRGIENQNTLLNKYLQRDVDLDLSTARLNEARDEWLHCINLAEFGSFESLRKVSEPFRRGQELVRKSKDLLNQYEEIRQHVPEVLAFLTDNYPVLNSQCQRVLSGLLRIHHDFAETRTPEEINELLVELEGDIMASEQNLCSHKQSDNFEAKHFIDAAMYNYQEVYRESQLLQEILHEYQRQRKEILAQRQNVGQRIAELARLQEKEVDEDWSIESSAAIINGRRWIESWSEDIPASNYSKYLRNGHKLLNSIKALLSSYDRAVSDTRKRIEMMFEALEDARDSLQDRHQQYPLPSRSHRDLMLEADELRERYSSLNEPGPKTLRKFESELQIFNKEILVAIGDLRQEVRDFVRYRKQAEQYKSNTHAACNSLIDYINTVVIPSRSWLVLDGMDDLKSIIEDIKSQDSHLNEVLDEKHTGSADSVIRDLKEIHYRYRELMNMLAQRKNIISDNYNTLKSQEDLIRAQITDLRSDLDTNPDLHRSSKNRIKHVIKKAEELQKRAMESTSFVECNAILGRVQELVNIDYESHSFSADVRYIENEINQYGGFSNYGDNYGIQAGRDIITQFERLLESSEKQRK